MRGSFVAAVAALTFGTVAPDRSQAMPLGGSALKPALDAVGHVSTVRYCEYFDPLIGGWVTFWVPGPCLAYGAPGFDIWLGRHYRGGRHWRGRLHDRPWVGGPRGPRVGERGMRVGPRDGVHMRRDGGRRGGDGGGGGRGGRGGRGGQDRR